MRRLMCRWRRYGVRFLLRETHAAGMSIFSELVSCRSRGTLIIRGRRGEELACRGRWLGAGW